MTFDIILHIGTLVPILFVYRKELLALLRNPLQKFTFLLIVGTLPAIIFTLLFGDLVENLFQGGMVLAFEFIITGCLLVYADTFNGGTKKLKHITYLDALIIGCMQAVAIMPAISRSGSTITGALARKLDRETAAKFSFMLSIPAILGAAVLTLKDVITSDVPQGIELLPTLFGFFAAVLTGLLSIRFMQYLIKRSKLRYFSYYVFVLAVLIFFDSLFTKFFF